MFAPGSRRTEADCVAHVATEAELAANQLTKFVAVSSAAPRNSQRPTFSEPIPSTICHLSRRRNHWS